LVAALVPLRSIIVPRLFSPEDLQYLDPVGECEDDYIEEQKEIHAAERRPSIDEAELFNGLSGFRTKDVPHDANEYYQHHPEFVPPTSSFPLGSDDVGDWLRHRKQPNTATNVAVVSSPSEE
jgi:hypothetical protein